MANILSGLMTHASTHPCTWCDIKKNMLESGHLRTIHSITENFRKLAENGSVNKDAIFF